MFVYLMLQYSIFSGSFFNQIYFDISRLIWEYTFFFYIHTDSFNYNVEVFIFLNYNVQTRSFNYNSESYRILHTFQA